MEKKHSSGSTSSMPYSVDEAKKERSRVLAHKRRATNRSVMDELTQVLPLPKDVVTHLDYSSKLRLSLCFFRLKTLTGTVKSEVDEEKEELNPVAPAQCSSELTTYKKKSPLFNLGMLQDLMTEALDGFLLVLSSDGVVIYTSESIHHHLGLFQSEHIGVSIFDLISDEDQKEVRETLLQAESKAMSFRSVEVSFFCRMKCSRFKIHPHAPKSTAHKLVYVSGRLKLIGSEQYLVTVVRPVNPIPISEIPMEANLFVTNYDMNMECTYYDGRMKHLLGYTKHDLVGRSPFGLQHHEDLGATAKCGEGIVSKGEGLSGYYRFMCRGGYYVWLQTRGTLMHDGRTGKPTHIVCLNYIISKEDGDRDLLIRQVITNSSGPNQKESYDPFPLSEREDGEKVNPLKDTSWGHKDDVILEDVYIQDKSHLLEKPVEVKQEKASDIGKSSTNWSPADSGFHSASTDKSKTFSSTTSVLSSDLYSKGSHGSSDLCVPDSTTDSSPEGSSLQGKHVQTALDSLAPWTSPSNGSSLDANLTTPPSVFSKNSVTMSNSQTGSGGENAPALLAGNSSVQSTSLSHYQGASGPNTHQEISMFSVNGNQVSSDVSFISQINETGQHKAVRSNAPSASSHVGLMAQNGHVGSESITTDSFSSFPRQPPNQQQSGTGSNNKSLYQLLSQQPLPNSNSAPSYQQPLEIPPNYPSGYQNMAVKNKYAVDASNKFATELPPWNGMGREGSMGSYNQHYHHPMATPVQARLDFVQQNELSFANGNPCAQGVWPEETNALPQLTDEDMKMLDCFNEAPPTADCLPYPQVMPMAGGSRSAIDGR